MSKDEMLGLIKFLEKPLEFYKDPVYTSEEKEGIRKFEELAFEFYNDLKKDGHISMKVAERERKEDKRIIRFFKIVMDISNKLVKTKEFNPEESWFILLSLYCWQCEVIKNLLSQVAIKIYESLESEEWKGFVMMKAFMDTMNKYKNGRYSSLFSDIDVDLRNSFVHGKINFPHNEIEYYDSEGDEKQLKLDDFLSKYKKLPPLYAILFLYRTRVFVDEIKDIAKKRGFL